jgi:hypothetical protein
MVNPRRKDTDVETEVMVANRHTCCVCNTPNLDVQLHHIDSNRANTVAQNLAVVCVQDHSRLTSDGGLGRRFTRAEVTEYKRIWEAKCKSLFEAQTSREEIEKTLEDRNEGKRMSHKDLIPMYSNPDLARAIGAAVGVEIDGHFGAYLIDRLTVALAGNGRLSYTRPTTRAAYEPNQLIRETVAATKVIIRHQTLKDTVPGVRELAVWVAEPGAESLRRRKDDRYDFTGTFLYLVTALYDEGQLDTFYSGCSALQVISNLVTGQPFLTVDWEEPLARGSYAHPIEKLTSIGGIVIDKRIIETLYKPRYISDEQCFIDGDTAYRVHDLLAYPLFIGNCFEAVANNILSKSRGDLVPPAPHTPVAPSGSGSST